METSNQTSDHQSFSPETWTVESGNLMVELPNQSFSPETWTVESGNIMVELSNQSFSPETWKTMESENSTVRITFLLKIR